MRILFVHPSVELYGADKILLYMLKILAENEHDLTVLLPKEGILIQHIRSVSPAIKIMVDGRLPIAHSKLSVKEYLWLPERIRQIGKRFPQKSFDIVYCNTLATVLLLYTNWGKKRICHVHEIIENKVLNLAFSLLVHFRTKDVICVSSRVKNNLLFSKKYAVVHNGIPDLAGKTLANNVGEKIVFALPGRFMPKKGQWFLVEALKLLPKDCLSQIKVVLYGSAPPNRPELQEDLDLCVRSNGLTDTVEIHPFVSDISEIYKKANVILVPSLMADPFPTTVLEALMFSRPVLATNNGGAVEILDDSYARLISPNDVDAFVAVMKFFIDNKAMISEMGKKARAKYEEYLTVKMFEKRFLQFLK